MATKTSNNQSINTRINVNGIKMKLTFSSRKVKSSGKRKDQVVNRYVLGFTSGNKIHSIAFTETMDGHGKSTLTVALDKFPLNTSNQIDALRVIYLSAVDGSLFSQIQGLVSQSKAKAQRSSKSTVTSS